MVSLTEQLSAFALTILGGIGMGVVYDLLRVVRGAVGTRRPFVWIFDVLYWMLVTPFIIALLWRANYGELRFYVVIGVIIGSLTYNTMVSPFMLELFSALLYGTFRLIGWLVHTVVAVVTWPVFMIRSIVLARRPALSATSGKGLNFRRWLMSLPWRPAMAWRRR